MLPPRPGLRVSTVHRRRTDPAASEVMAEASQCPPVGLLPRTHDRFQPHIRTPAGWAGHDRCWPFLKREGLPQVRAEDTQPLNTKGTLGWT